MGDGDVARWGGSTSHLCTHLFFFCPIYDTPTTHCVTSAVVHVGHAAQTKIDGESLAPWQQCTALCFSNREGADWQPGPRVRLGTAQGILTILMPAPALD